MTTELDRLLSADCTISATVSVPQSVTHVRAYDNTHEMVRRVGADLESRLVRELVDHTVRQMATKVGLSPELFGMFLEFLGHDPEIQDRFASYVAAQRILR